jgi:hypothetical protein
MCSHIHTVLQMLLLKKVLYTLHKHACQSSALRRALASLHRRHLRYAWSALQSALAALLQRPTAALTPHKALAAAALQQQQQVVVRDGRGRQGHCKCVYNVTASGSRCRCAPAAHLLRRVEELHKLVTHAMHSPDYRLLSHVTQYRVVASDSGATATAAAAAATSTDGAASAGSGRLSREAVEQAALRRHLCYDDATSTPATATTAARAVGDSGRVNKPEQQQQRRVPLQPRPRAQRDRPQPHASSSGASSALKGRTASTSKADQLRQSTVLGRPRKNRPNPNATPVSSSSVHSSALHSRAAVPQQQQQQQQQRRSKSPVRRRRPPGMPPRHDMSHW